MANKVKRAWFIDVVSGDTKLGIVEKTSRTVDGITDEWKAITEVLQVRYDFILCDADLTGVASEWTEINSRYHRTIVDKAIAMGYRDPRNLNIQNAQYFESLYLEAKRRAKKFAKGGYQASGRIVPQDF